MAEQKKELTTALSEWTNRFTSLVERDFAECGVSYTDADKSCAMSAMTTIYGLMKDSKKDPNSFDLNSIRQAVGQAASLRLNATAYPSECFFQIRNKQDAKGNWTPTVEMGIMGAGNDAILRNFGVGVQEVMPVWIVHEGDDFEYPSFNGLEITPPKWTPKAWGGKVVRVVYPVKMTDGRVQYLISERDAVRVNLVAHIRNNLLNETFGICADRYKATPAQKEQIKAKKQEIMDVVSQFSTVDEILACPTLKPYISMAWLDSTESMVERKMRNNAIRNFPKDYSSPMAKRSMIQADDVYKANQAEIEANANTEELTIESEDVVEVEAEVVSSEPV